MKSLTPWQFLVLPLTLSVSLAVSAQSLPEAIQTAIDNHPELRASASSRLSAKFSDSGFRVF